MLQEEAPKWVGDENATPGGCPDMMRIVRDRWTCLSWGLAAIDPLALAGRTTLGIHTKTSSGGKAVLHKQPTASCFEQCCDNARLVLELGRNCSQVSQSTLLVSL